MPPKKIRRRTIAPHTTLSSKKRTAVTVLLSLLAVVVMILFVCGAFFAWQLSVTTVPSAKDIPLPQNVAIVNSTGGKIGTLTQEDGNRVVVPARKMSKHLPHAIVAAEDRTFWDNNGYDLKGIGRAIIGHMKNDPNAGGGSTITQQYVKNSIGSKDYTLARKWSELILSIKMTRAWSKQDILTNYLNTVYFGRGAYGVEKASQSYFGVSAQHLSIAQSAFLAGVVQRPSYLDPDIHRKESEQRWNYVMSSMHSLGYISTEEYTTAQFPYTIPYRPAQLSSDANGHIVRQVAAELDNVGWTKDKLASHGITTIVTTIDAKAQSAAVAQSQAVMKAQPGLRTATVSINPRTGGVKAYFGGTNGVGFDYAHSWQMTGSSFKVFALAAALDQDIPLVGRTFSASPYTMGNVTVTNASSGCNPCTMAQATLYSLNTSFYRIQDALANGPQDTAQMAYAAGIPQEKPDGTPTLRDKNGVIYPGIVLGQYQTRPIDMASAYATFAAQGAYAKPHFIAAIKAGKDTVYSAEVSLQQRMRANVANSVTYALQPVAAYSYHPLAGGRPSASKTGTVQLGSTGRNRDAWMVGYTPSLSTATWVGTDKGVPLVYQGADVWGATVPSTIWKATMDAGLEGTTIEQFPTPQPIDGWDPAPRYQTPTQGQKTTGKKHKSGSTHKPSKPKGGHATPQQPQSTDDSINGVLNYLFRQGD